MEEEEARKKRRLQNGAPSTPKQPMEAEAAAESEEEKLKEFVVNADHDFLIEKIQRLGRQINSPFTLKLPDKGEKIRRSLTICEQELERRKQISPTITTEAECENSKQSKSSSSPVASHSPNQKSASPVPTDQGVSSEFRSDALLSKDHVQSKSTSWLFQMLGEKKGLPVSGGANYQNTEPKGLFLNKDRREFKLSLRQPPFCRRFSGHDGNVGNFPQRLSRRGPSAAPLAEILRSIHAMQQQFENMSSQLNSFESNITTRIDRLETKVEQIIQGQGGDKSTNASTS